MITTIAECEEDISKSRLVQGECRKRQIEKTRRYALTQGQTNNYPNACVYVYDVSAFAAQPMGHRYTFGLVVEFTRKAKNRANEDLKSIDPNARQYR